MREFELCPEEAITPPQSEKEVRADRVMGGILKMIASDKDANISLKRSSDSDIVVTNHRINNDPSNVD